MNELKSKTSNVKKNLLFSILSISSRLISNVFLFWILARIYEPEIFGQFTFAHTLATTLIVLADFGLDIFLTTEIAQQKENAVRIFRSLFSYKLVFTSVSVILMILLALIFHLEIESKILVIIFSIFLAATTLLNFLFALFKGFEVLEYELKVSLIMNSTLIIVMFLLFILKVNILAISIGFVFTRILGLILGIKFSYKLVPDINYNFALVGFDKIKNKMFIFGFHFIFSYLFFQLDTILLTLLKGEYYAGIYQAVFKFIMLPLIIPEILINVLLPVLSRLYYDDILIWRKTGQIMSKILLILGIPLCAILFSFSDEIIKYVYGAKYHDAVPVLKIFAITILVRFCLEPFALMLTTSNRQKIRMYVVSIATLLNLLLNYLIIPIYGVLGAAIISLITNTFVGICFMYFARDLFMEWMVNIKTLFLFTSLFFFMIISVFIIKQSLVIILPFFFIVISLFIVKYYLTEEEKRVFVADIFNKVIVNKFWKN